MDLPRNCLLVLTTIGRLLLNLLFYFLVRLYEFPRKRDKQEWKEGDFSDKEIFYSLTFNDLISTFYHIDIFELHYAKSFNKSHFYGIR